MNLTHIAVVAACALVITGCNRETSDQGTAGQNSATGTRQENSSTPPSTDRTTPSGSSVGSAASSADANAARPADNTGKNVRDRSDAALTPGDQSESKSDLELTRQIRRAITQNDQLSTTAKNVKIITANGKVTLRGPVNSEAEKEQIAASVQKVTGVNSVDNQLEVKQNQ